jgi:hypothetical protein
MLGVFPTTILERYNHTTLLGFTHSISENNLRELSPDKPAWVYSKYLRQQLQRAAATQTCLVLFLFSNKARSVNMIKKSLQTTHSNFRATTKL